MTIPEPLNPDQLYRRCNPDQFGFDTTAELDDLQEIIGQDRAVEAIRVSIGIPHEGFNLFALGPNGTGKYTAVRQFLGQRAPDEPTPDDWCYVYNFDQPHQPNALRLPPGQATVFAQHMERLVTELGTVLPAAFSSDEYENQKKAIRETYDRRETEMFEELQSEAQERGIAFLRAPAGFVFAPLKKGEVISPDAFMQLPEEERKEIEKQVEVLQEKLHRIINQMPQWRRESERRLKQLKEEVADFAATPLFRELEQRYEGQDGVLAYLAAVKKDAIDNVDRFLDDGEETPGLLPGPPRSPESPPFQTRYAVNVLVDHGGEKGAPIIFEDQPNYFNLLGRIEHVAQMGTLVTNFTLIKPGALHRANGGYLVLDALKVLNQPFAWDGLKRALRAREIRIESLTQSQSLISTVSLDPAAIPMKVKVVLLGDRLLYYLLNAHDPDFGELFKVAADFEDDMPWDEANGQAYARLIAGLARKERLRHFDRAAVARVIEHSARLAGDASKLTTHMQSVTDLLREADYWAGSAGHELVTSVDIQEALDAQVYRASRIRERIQESMLRETLLIATSGTAVGQINGLSVLGIGHYFFGRPSRITARVRLGKGEVVDIERQVEMGGPLHSKGVLILAGFLGARYAAERPLSLAATLVFEQSYSGVDGDSASSAELYALLSALADAPIRQSLAVTGSVNQHGQIQAIGGVNEKIEGFFDLCQARGLTGDQGVLIPVANVQHLMLRQDVRDAVAAGQFAIYAVATVDEGIALLTGQPAGEPDEAGQYPDESINGRVVARLQALAEAQRAFYRPPE